MATNLPPDISKIIRSTLRNEGMPANELLPQVYSELRMLARSRLKRMAPGETMQATALVHEAYLRLIDGTDPGWDNPGHFFGAAAQAMRDILVEQARRKNALKRGGNRDKVDIDLVDPSIPATSDEILAVNEAVKRLEREDPRKGKIVNLRYFAQLSTTETAVALDISIATVGREWRYIRAWLERELSGKGDA